ncbi:S8 family serine peptidase [Virgisporangium aliadipatigenens]|uniref:S8 family serine peptidase n=1 Tax=Virgisporangium aliadipatigenens TaxID=741659 RepID=UPI001941938A|nr:S8 family serine peptidase [Virgisporangium aliadipatigenens]
MRDGVRETGPTLAEAPQAVQDRYIVVLRDAKVAAGQVDAAANRLGSRVGARVGHRYNKTIRGFSATMDAAAARRLAAEPDVARVEPVVTYKQTDTQTSPTWGLDRIDEYSLPLNRGYTYPGKADGVHVYVVDSGIRAAHSEVRGRVAGGVDLVENDGNPDDCEGHGTHVAGTIGGTTYGVAKGVTLHSVRVLDCQGLGTTDDILAGVEWVTANAVRPSVVNMSLSGPAGTVGSIAVDTAITAAILTGLTFTVAAGNDEADACNYSPGDVPGAITVGATDTIDYVAAFSNYGSCVDIFAPGVDIASAYYTGGAVSRSGTSMAAPHVAGAAALLLAGNPLLSPAQIASQLRQDSAAAVHNRRGSPNALLQLPDASNEGASLSLIARINARFVSAADSTGVMYANNVAPGRTETFERVELGNDTFALRVTGTGMFVSLGTDSKLVAVSNDQARAEKFTLVPVADLGFGLRASNGSYVAADNAGAGALVANRASVGEWETFEKQAPNVVISLKSLVNSSYVTAENGGASPLIANRPTAGEWESFDLVETADGYVGLRSHANGLYVTAENGGAGSMIANRVAIGPWEKFRFYPTGAGTVAILALANSKYVTAENAGKSPLVPRAAKPGDWELFARTTTIV